MKVLFNCHVPFMLAHGGAQVQIEQTKAALEQIGVETDYLQWWNDRQTGDILHHFGALPEETIRQAHDKGCFPRTATGPGGRCCGAGS